MRSDSSKPKSGDTNTNVDKKDKGYAADDEDDVE